MVPNHKPTNWCHTTVLPDYVLLSNRVLHESIVKIKDIFHQCEKFCLFTERSTAEPRLKDLEFLTQVEDIPIMNID